MLAIGSRIGDFRRNGRTRSKWNLVPRLSPGVYVKSALRSLPSLGEILRAFGVTTTRMALWKSSEQQIHTVDSYSWTGWGIDPESHFELTSEALFDLTLTGPLWALAPH